MSLFLQEHPKHASLVENQDDSDRWNERERPDFVPQREAEVVGRKLPCEEPKRNERPCPLHYPKEGNDNSVKPISCRKDGDEQQEEKTNQSRKQSYRNIPPPYIIEKPGKEHAAEENKAHEDELTDEAKLKPRSVRQSRLKHSAGHEAEQSSRATETSDSQNEVNEEESDGLNGSLKLPQLRESDLSRDSNNSSNQKDGISEFGVPPTRAASLPADATSLTESDEITKGHHRANSLQNQMFLGHVHPNLPDYADLVSRIAALRGR